MDKKIKEFLDRCYVTKYKSPNKASRNNSNLIEDNTTNHSSKTNIGSTSRNKNAELIIMKDITNNQPIKNKIPTNNNIPRIIPSVNFFLILLTFFRNGKL